VGKGRPECLLELVGALHRGAVEPDGAGDTREVGVLEIRAEAHETRSLHLELHERECPVVEHDDLDG